jgi:hypothetical protein
MDFARPLHFTFSCLSILFLLILEQKTLRAKQITDLGRHYKKCKSKTASPATVAPLPLWLPSWRREGDGCSGSRFVCLSPRVSRFLSLLCESHHGADVDNAIWNNGLSTHALARRRRRWRRRVFF